MKVWITKYALSEGIIEAEAEIVYQNIVEVKMKDGRSIRTCELEEECCMTREGAVKKAEEMRKVKIAILKKQIEKLEKMRFE